MLRLFADFRENFYKKFLKIFKEEWSPWVV